MLVSQRVHGFKRRLILWMVTKSCTRQGNYERYLWNTVNNGKTHLPTGAGFLPSAVWRWICKRHILSFGEHMIKLMGFPSISSLMFTGLHSLVRTTWLQAGALLHFFFRGWHSSDRFNHLSSPWVRYFLQAAASTTYHDTVCLSKMRPKHDAHHAQQGLFSMILIVCKKKRDITHTHMLHVWNNYQHLPHKWPSFVGKYTIHGAYGIDEWHGGKKPHIWP